MSSSRASSHGNHVTQVVSASVTLIVLPTVFVTLRLISRRKSRADFWWDDGAVILAMILSWGFNIIGILASHRSLGQHLQVLGQAGLVSFFRYLYPLEIVYSLGMTCVKLSVILFLYPIFPVVPFRRIISACGAFIVAFGTASTIVFVFQCVPIRDSWVTADGNLPSTGGGRCLNLFKFQLANGCINTFTDFTLVLLPLPLLWRLKASNLQKCILTGIFVTGLIVTAVGMVRLVAISRFGNKDVTYNYVTPWNWTDAELSIAVVSACLPSLRPLFVRAAWSGTQRPNARRNLYIGSSKPTSWTLRRSRKAQDRSFNKLPENGKGAPGSWTNNVAVCGGQRVQGHEEEILELSTHRHDEMETPLNRIKAKTTVVLTISDRIDWQDRIF